MTPECSDACLSAKRSHTNETQGHAGPLQTGPERHIPRHHHKPPKRHDSCRIKARPQPSHSTPSSASSSPTLPLNIQQHSPPAQTHTTQTAGRSALTKAWEAWGTGATLCDSLWGLGAMTQLRRTGSPGSFGTVGGASGCALYYFVAALKGCWPPLIHISEARTTKTWLPLPCGSGHYMR